MATIYHKVSSSGYTFESDTPSTTSVLATSGWTTALDLDFSSLSTGALTSGNGTKTFGGYSTWVKANSANDATAMAITGGSGLVIVPGSTSDYNGATRTCPIIGLPISSAITNFDAMRMALRLWIYTSSVNYAANYDSVVFGFDDGSAVSGMIAKVGYYVGGVGLTRFFQSNSLNVGFNNCVATAANTNNVSLIEAPLGVYGGLIKTAVGTYSSGFPADTAMKWHTGTNNYGVTTQVTNGNTTPASTTWYAQIGAQRAASVTSLSVTVARMKIEYKPL